MTSLAPSTPFSSGRVARFDDGVWLIRGLQEARDVLADNEAFRTPHPHEFVPGFSRSFFLATDTGAAEDRRRFRAALAAAVSPRRMQRLAAEVLAPTARRLAMLVVTQATFDVLDEYVRPYTRQVSYHLSGIRQDLAVELGARLGVASELIREDPADSAARSLLTEVWQRIERMAQRGELDDDGLAGYALRRGFITVSEAPLLTIPVLEMAALDMSGALTLAALTAVSDLAPDTQRTLAETRRCRAAVWEAARRLDDIYITRVATQATTVGAARIRSGDRLLIHVPAANSDDRVYAVPAVFDPARDSDHIAFGHGAHVCMGRELALTTAVVGLRELLRRGTLGPVQENNPEKLRLAPHTASGQIGSHE